MKTYEAADEAGDKEDDGGRKEDAVGDDKLVEKGGVSLGSKQTNSCELVALNLVGTWSPLLCLSFTLLHQNKLRRAYLMHNKCSNGKYGRQTPAQCV